MPPKMMDDDDSSSKQNEDGSYTCNWEPLDGGWAASLLRASSKNLKIRVDTRGRLERRCNVNSRSPSPKGSSAPAWSPRFVRKYVNNRTIPCSRFEAKVKLDVNAETALTHLITMSGRTGTHINDILQTCNSSYRRKHHPEITVNTIEAVDDQSDIIHLKQAPMFLFPSWTAPRDYCLKRSWKQKRQQKGDDNSKGSSFIVRYNSVVHRACCARTGYTRGRLHGYFKIEPCAGASRSDATRTRTRTRTRSKSRRCKKEKMNDQLDFVIANEECVVTQVVQVDPMGWVPTTRLKNHHNQSYADAFAISMLFQLVDIRDELNHPLSTSSVTSSFAEFYNDLSSRTTYEYAQEYNNNKMMNSAATEKQVNWSMPLDDYFFIEEEKKGDVTVSAASIKLKKMQSTTFANIIPALSKHMWGTVDATTWDVRGKNYMVDGKKYQCDDAVFRLVVIDLVETSGPILTGMCSHPKERLQLALEKEKRGFDCGLSPFFVVFNLYVPGPPHYHLVMYFGVDDVAVIQGKTGTPFSKQAERFIFGKDDTFRNHVFKLFPRITEGNFVVRKAVGSTPVLLGKRLKHYYYQTDRYFEMVVDISSKLNAASIVKLSTGFAKSLTVDMAFGLEGNDETTLPERLMGCCRLQNISFDDLRYVLHPQDDDDILKEFDCAI